MNIAAAVIPFWGAIKTFQAATSPAAICCVLRLDTIGNIGHNQSKNCETLCFSPSKLNDMHGKLNKIEFCYKFCRIWPLGRLAAIIIDILSGPRQKMDMFLLVHRKCTGYKSRINSEMIKRWRTSPESLEQKKPQDSIRHQTIKPLQEVYR